MPAGAGLTVLAVLLGAWSADGGAAVDFHDTVNRLRAGQGACAVATPLAPLRRDPALDRAAARLARGQSLHDSLNASGYRASTSRAIGVSGAVSEEAGAVLGGKYCEQLLLRALSDIGIYQDARRSWIIVAAPLAPQVVVAPEAAAQRVLELVNEARDQARDCGSRRFEAARALRPNAVLAAVALLHSEDMAQNNYFSHSGRDGSAPAARVERGGYQYRATGENIAAGQTTAEDAVAAWLKSAPHCANLMNPAFTVMGVAHAVDRKSEFGVYWVLVFGTPR